MKENGTKISIADILRSSMTGLVESDADVYQQIISLADAEFFEQHQTAGRLQVLADKLLTIPVEGGMDDEGN